MITKAEARWVCWALKPREVEGAFAQVCVERYEDGHRLVASDGHRLHILDSGWLPPLAEPPISSECYNGAEFLKAGGRWSQLTPIPDAGYPNWRRLLFEPLHTTFVLKSEWLAALGDIKYPLPEIPAWVKPEKQRAELRQAMQDMALELMFDGHIVSMVAFRMMGDGEVSPVVKIRCSPPVHTEVREYTTAFGRPYSIRNWRMQRRFVLEGVELMRGAIQIQMATPNQPVLLRQGRYAAMFATIRHENDFITSTVEVE